MDVSARFVADFSSFRSQLQQAEIQVKGFDTDLDTINKTLSRFGDTFSGKKIIQDATLMAGAVANVGGVSALTDKELQKLSRTTSEAAEKMQKLGIDVPPGFQKIHDEAENATKSNKTWADSFNSLSTVVQGFLALKVVGWFKDAIAAGFEYADQLDNLSVATGISSKGLQRLEAIGVTSGVTMDTLARSVETLHRKLDDPAAVAAIQQMGLDYARIRNLKPEDQFLAIAEAVSQIEDPVERANVGSALFGKTWDAISPAITANMRDVLNGVVSMSDGTVKALNRAGNAWDVFKLNQTRRLDEFLGLLVQAGDEAQISWKRIVFAPGSVPGALVAGAARATAKNLEELPDVPNAPPVSLPRGFLPSEQTSFLAESNKLAASLEAQEQKNKRAAQEWNAALSDIRDNWKAIFATIEHLQPLEVKTFQALSLATPGAGLAHLLPNFSMQDQHLGFGPADIATAARENIEATTRGLFDGVGNAVPQAILASFEGGGSAAKAAAGSIGVKIGQNVVDKFGSSITGTLGKTFGGAINAVLPGIGTLAAPLVGMIGKLFGPSEESSKVSPLRDEFFKMAGGLETLNPKVQELTGSLSLVDNIFKAKTIDQYNAAIQTLTGELAFQDQAMQTLTDTAKKYGFTLDELGPAFERQQLDQKAQELYKDWQVLASGGIDIDNIAKRMGGSINDFVHNAMAMGTEIPSQMKPMLEQMAKMGLLTDTAGNKIDDLDESGLSFSMTMSQGFKTLIEQVEKLTKAISSGLGLAIQNLPDKTVTIHAKYDVPPELQSDWPEPPGFATGTHGRLLDFGSGTLVKLHGFEQVRTAQEARSERSRTDALEEQIAGLRNDLNQHFWDLPKSIAYAVQAS